jgi:hypothetical protein
MNIIPLLIIIYIVGFFLSLLFWKKFGKKLGFDYDPPHDGWYDDWEDNTQAYTSFSMFWFIDLQVLSIFGIWKLLTILTRKILKQKT